MQEFVWSEDFSVGVHRFDEQHKQLIGMLNQLIRDPSATTNSETVSEILARMTDYAQEHFKAEEDLMLEHDYPGYREHRSHHQAFLHQVVQFSAATNRGDEMIPQKLFDFLKDWLATHVLEEDMAYRDFFQGKGLK